VLLTRRSEALRTSQAEAAQLARQLQSMQHLLDLQEEELRTYRLPPHRRTQPRGTSTAPTTEAQARPKGAESPPAMEAGFAPPPEADAQDSEEGDPLE
jgi:hypothetical protein